MKGIPLAYNKDMQEDKESVFDAVDTVKTCIPVFTSMLRTRQVLPQNMQAAARKGFINATDCADYLAKGHTFPRRLQSGQARPSIALRAAARSSS